MMNNNAMMNNGMFISPIATFPQYIPVAVPVPVAPQMMPQSHGLFSSLFGRNGNSYG